MCALSVTLLVSTAAYLRRVPRGSALQATTEQLLLLLSREHVAIFTVVVIAHK